MRPDLLMKLKSLDTMIRGYLGRAHAIHLSMDQNCHEIHCAAAAAAAVYADILGDGTC